MNLFQDIENAINEIGHGWTSVPKAQVMASMIVALRPAISVEIGVYAGKGLVPMALAHKFVGHGRAIGIDPYSAAAAVESQCDADRKFWGEQVNYQAMKDLCVATMDKYGASQHYGLIVERSDKATVDGAIGMLRIDGNHGEPAMADAIRWSPQVAPGGFIFCDDIGWTGGATTRAAQWLAANGCRELYKLDDSIVFQKL